MTIRNVMIVGALLAGLSAPAVAQTPITKWVPYSPLDKSFSVEFPEQRPVSKDSVVKNADGTPSGVVIHQEMVQLSKDLIFSIFYKPIPRFTTPQTALADAAQPYDTNFRVVRTENPTIEGAEMVHKWYAPTNGNALMETVIVATGSQLIYLNSFCKPELTLTEITAMISHFFKSFTLKGGASDKSDKKT
jgi:hypothetical protein